MAQTAEILTFPTRRVHAPTLAPTSQASAENAHRQTRVLIAAHRQADRAELVAALLLAMENAPLTPAFCYPSRPIDGPGVVIVTLGDLVFSLTPEDCRTAAQTLLAEQAFAGCAGVAANLREASALAEARGPRGGRIDRPALSHGHTGMATTLCFAAMIFICLGLGLSGGL